MIGYQHFSYLGTYWRRNHGVLFPLSLPHAIPDLKKSDVRKMLVRFAAPFVRWEEEFDRLESGPWWHVIKDESENLDALGKKTRYLIRRGARNLEVAPVERSVILSEAYDVYKAAFNRYETFETVLSADAFREAIVQLPQETEFWVVRDRETKKLAAFSENIVRDNACFYNTMWFRPESLKDYAGYVLIHEMNKYYLNVRKLLYVSDGARSISHQTNIHEFLEQKFGFRKAYARLQVVYLPGVGMVVGALYPFREWFKRRSSGMFQKLAVVLEQERIRRACEKGLELR